MGLSISCQVYVSHVHSGVVMRVVMAMMSVPVHQIDSPNPSPVLDHLLFTLPLRKKKSNRDQANICTPENGSGMLKEKKKIDRKLLCSVALPSGAAIALSQI